MSEISCLTNIQSKLKLLTNTEKKVADFILNNYRETLDYTVTELAEHAEVSDATVVRFCRSVGYKGYQDLKINLARDAIAPYKHLNTSLEEADTPAQITEKMIRSEISVLEETINLLDMKEMELAATAIKNAKRVFLFGSGGSILVAQDAMHKFLKIGVQCIVQMDADVQAMESALMEKGDVAIGISHSGTNRNVIECLKNARANGAITIGLTTYGKSPMQKHCNCLLMTSTKETVFKSESLTARIAQLAVIDSLSAIISFMDYEKAYEAIQKTRNATSERKF
ncbi:MAG: MurR/RpiR family transcriptional regulator [Clostridiales bacterium]|nr:MurR/RpiR family transcriptional regulator [Clostridiales bacterium]